MTAVFDTHVVVAALLANGLCHECFQRTVRKGMLASSPSLLNEIESTLRPRFLITLPIEAFLRELRNKVRLVDPEPLPARVCRDERGDLLLATAAKAEARAIVSADPDLLAMGAWEGIPLMPPRRFLQRLDGQAES